MVQRNSKGEADVARTTDNLSASNFIGETELHFSQTSLDKGIAAATDDVDEQQNSRNPSRKNRRTLQHENTEDEEKKKAQNRETLLWSGQGNLSNDIMGAPDTSELVDDEEPGFDIEIRISAESPREVRRRSSSRERGRRSRSSSRDAIRQVRERSMQRRSERGNKKGLNSSNGSLERIDLVPGKPATSSPQINTTGSAVDNDIGLQIHHESSPSKGHSTGRSPRRGARSRSSERALVSEREISRKSEAKYNDLLGQPRGLSINKGSDRSKSTSSRIHHSRGSSRERRRSQRDNQLRQDITESCHKETAEICEKTSSIERTVDGLNGTEEAATTSDSRKSATLEKNAETTTTGARRQDSQTRRTHRSSSRDVLRSSRSDSKERNRKSRSGSKERPAGARSSNDRSNKRENHISSSEEDTPETNQLKGQSIRHRPSKDTSSERTPVEPAEKPTARVPRRNSREDFLHRNTIVESQETNESARRIPRRRSREDILQQRSESVTGESSAKKEAPSRVPRRSSREGLADQKTQPTSVESGCKNESMVHVVRRSSREDLLSRKTQQESMESCERNEATSQVVRRNSREVRPTRRSSRENIGRPENAPIERKITSEKQKQKNHEFDQEKGTSEQESSMNDTPRAIPQVIFHDDEERKRMEQGRALEKATQSIEINPAMALLSHLGLGIVDARPNSPTENLDNLKVPSRKNSSSGHRSKATTPNSEVWPDEGIKDTSDLDAHNQNALIYTPSSDLFLTKTSSEASDIESTIDDGRQSIAPAEEQYTTGKVGVPDEFTPCVSINNSTSQLTGLKGSNDHPVIEVTAPHPAADLLGFLGSNYNDLLVGAESSFPTSAFDLVGENQAESSIDFFQTIKSTKVDPMSTLDDFDQVEGFVGGIDNSFGETGKHLAPPSVAPLDESAKQKARLARRVNRQNRFSLDKFEAKKPSTLAPPSLAGDMPKLMQKRIRKQKAEEAAASGSKGVVQTQNDEGGHVASMLDIEEEPVKRHTSRPKIRRSKIESNGVDDMCEQSLAPPSLAPPSLAPMTRNRPSLTKVPEREEDIPRKVTRREARKATQFASLDEEADDDSVGIIISEPTPAVVPKRRGMLSKAQSAVNVLEKTTKRVVKKATSTKNLFA